MQRTPITGSTLFEGELDTDKVTDYVGNMIYENGELARILIDNDYYVNLDKKYYFYVKDHLGNNRVVTDKGGTAVQSNQYYPLWNAICQ